MVLWAMHHDSDIPASNPTKPTSAATALPALVRVLARRAAVEARQAELRSAEIRRDLDDVEDRSHDR